MESILLAMTTSTYALLAAAFALLLLLVFQIRLAKKHEAVEDELHRLQKEQKQAAVDARARMDDVTRAVDRLAEEVHPKLEAFAPDVARLGTSVEELGRRLEAYHPRAEETERHVADLKQSTDAVRAKATAAEKLAQEHSGRVGQVEGALGEVRKEVSAFQEELARTRLAITNQVGVTQAELKALGEKVADLKKQAAALARDADEPKQVAEPKRVAAETRPTADRAVEAPPRESEKKPIAPPAVEASPTPRTPTAAVPDFVFEESEEDDPTPGTRGLLALVIVLALLTLGFSLFGIGR